MKAKVYGSSQCVWCDRVAKLLEDSGADIEKVDVSQGKEYIKEMQESKLNIEYYGEAYHFKKERGGQAYYKNK